MNLGRVGVWSIGLRSENPAVRGEAAEAVAELEELGYGAVWLGGSPDVNNAAPLLEATTRIVVATGILNIWQHDAAGVAARHIALNAAHPGRFLLGLGVSHAVAVEGYRRPYSTMVGYLDELDSAGVPSAERVLAALGPRMLRLSGERAAGAHPYLVTPEYTRMARASLGDGPLLAPEVKVVLEEDPDRARAVARGHFARYLAMPNYTNNLMRLGFVEDDLDDGGSDRLVDALFVRGGVREAVARIAAHHDAGADHTCVQVLTEHDEPLPRHQWRDLAEALDLG